MNLTMLLYCKQSIFRSTRICVLLQLTVQSLPKMSSGYIRSFGCLWLGKHERKRGQCLPDHVRETRKSFALRATQISWSQSGSVALQRNPNTTQPSHIHIPTRVKRGCFSPGLNLILQYTFKNTIPKVPKRSLFFLSVQNILEPFWNHLCNGSMDVK